jgi:acyl-CoA synthetase (AMP-forming)/AMP-acid ligase II
MPSSIDAGPAPHPASLADVLRYRAGAQPATRAYVMLADRGGEAESITFSGLAERAAGLAREVAARAAPGERALLVCPNGIGCLIGFFACTLAGIVPVPMMPPRRHAARDSSAAILADCAPSLGLAPKALIAGERGDAMTHFAAAADLRWLAVDDAPAAPLDAVPIRAGTGSDTAFLQYTSGSTSAPKGVMVSHASLLANLAMIAEAFGNTRTSTYVGWVPLYHDMGLILSALQSLYVGATGVLMAPVAFLQRPLLWLRAIADYRAEIAAAPNFAYDLCVERYRPGEMAGIDLSGWRLALNGAEPVRAETLRRFAATFAPHGLAADALYPAYGLAEATVLVAAGRRGEGARIRTASRDGLRQGLVLPPRDADDAREVVGCGRALPGEEIAIVRPESREPLGADAIGEIWVCGPNVASGYWRNQAETAAAFDARIVGDDGGGRWLRTGDLGFRDAAGNLFVTGRLKEVAIIRGVNHYPQDIERTVALCHPALRRHGGAAFAVDAGGEERLVVAQEVERTWRNRLDQNALAAHIRDAVVRAHDIAPYDIALLRPGALPLTTSGKIQRAQARRLWLEGTLERI